MQNRFSLILAVMFIAMVTVNVTMDATPVFSSYSTFKSLVNDFVTTHQYVASV